MVRRRVDMRDGPPDTAAKARSIESIPGYDAFHLQEIIESSIVPAMSVKACGLAMAKRRRHSEILSGAGQIKLLEAKWQVLGDSGSSCPR
ncbi:hypothetical protein EJB05_19339, partial [Eragrostis curvula]